MIMMIMTDNA